MTTRAAGVDQQIADGAGASRQILDTEIQAIVSLVSTESHSAHRPTSRL